MAQAVTNGPGYLDHEQLIAAEIKRAEIEGREPDFENPPPIASSIVIYSDEEKALRAANDSPVAEEAPVAEEEAEQLELDFDA